MEYGLAVAGGLQGVTASLDVGAQRLVVVDLAVEDEPERAILVGDRLPAAGEVDDAQPADAQTGVTAEFETVVIGPAVTDRGGHPGHDVAVRRAIEIHDS